MEFSSKIIRVKKIHIQKKLCLVNQLFVKLIRYILVLYLIYMENLIMGQMVKNLFKEKIIPFLASFSVKTLLIVLGYLQDKFLNYITIYENMKQY